jgi:uncharacterized membrane protein
MKRSNSIDFTRGLVMIIMALDHTRDFMHVSSLTQSPTDITTTSPVLFFTRWITHFCAPVFVFLAGSSAYLSCIRQQDIKKTKRFLLSRGLWLVLLEFTVVNLALWFDLRFRNMIFEVIGAIGLSFVVLSFLLKLSPKTIGITGLLMIFLHDLFALIPFSKGSMLHAVLSPLFTLTPYALSARTVLLVAYPLIPWLGIMLTGFACGKLFELPESERKNIFVKMGVGALVLFLLFRFINIYGEPVKWAVQRNFIYSILSFLNVSKYPPSLLFTLLTLGGMSLVLAFSENIIGRAGRIVSVYGKVPFFYFLIHLYLLHFILLAILFGQGFQWKDFIFGNFRFGRPEAPSGLGLPVIYAVWVSIVVLLYPLCKWYGRYKMSHREKKWLRYL